MMIVGFKSNIRSTWETFLNKYFPSFQVFHTWEKYRDHQRGFKRAWGIRDQAILLIHYEGLAKIIDKVVRHQFDVVVYDEVHRLKSRSSATSRFARRLRTVPHRLALSGTPMDDSPNQMWGIMRFVEPEALGVQVKDYEAFFTRPSGYMGKTRKFKPQLHGIFLDRIRPFVYRVTKEDAGVTRSKTRWMPVRMKGEQKRIYEALERDMLVSVEGEIITTPLKITQIGKLQQITGGQVKDEEGELRLAGYAKKKVLRKILLEEDEWPIVIFCKYRHEVDMCVELARKIFPRVEKIDGSIKDKVYKRKPDQLHRTWRVQEFQRGEIDVLVCQQRTGGVGLDMYKANLAIVYSCGHSWIDFDQMSSRLDFINKEVASELLVLFVPDTIDEDIRTSIKNKVSVTTATLNRLRRKDQKWLRRKKPRRKQQQDPPRRKRKQQRPSSMASTMSRKSRA